MWLPNIQNTVLLLQQMVAEWRDVTDTLPVAKQIVDDLSKDEPNKSFVIETWDYYEWLWKRIKWELNNKIFPTWFRDIDSRLYGAAAWEVMAICARTWIWKTTLWIDMALNMSEKHKVGFITLEMTKEDMLDRMMSRECNIYLWTFYSNNFRQRDIDNIKQYWAKAKEKINNIRLAYWCFNIDDILATIEDMIERWCEVIFIDWLWMISAPWMRRNEQMHYVMTKLKDAATANNIAIVVMQQLNRQLDNVTRDEPDLYDIADSSAIEHISSPVLILRKDKFNKEDFTYCSLFKTRRINNDAKEQCVEIAKSEWKKRQEVFFKVILKDDLWHCSFKDFEWDLSTNTTTPWTKPF